MTVSMSFDMFLRRLDHVRHKKEEEMRFGLAEVVHTHLSIVNRLHRPCIAGCGPFESPNYFASILGGCFYSFGLVLLDL